MARNGRQLVVDADAHVLETERTWDYLEGSDKKFRPALFGSPDMDMQYWVMDGKIRGARFATLSEQQLDALSEKAGRRFTTPQASREMDDVDLRLAHLDQLGVDVQVMHNTMWIERVTDRTDAEVALCLAWNRWMADVWKAGGGKAPVVLRDPGHGPGRGRAADALRARKRRGGGVHAPLRRRPAPGGPVLLSGFRGSHGAGPGHRRAHRQREHRTHGAFPPALRQDRRLRAVSHPHGGHLPLAHHERGAARLPPAPLGVHRDFGAVDSLDRQRGPAAFGGGRLPDNPLKEYNVYVTAQCDDDFPYVLKYAGEDNIVIGTDYGHTDTSSEVDAITRFKGDPTVEDEPKRKILSDNPMALYGIGTAACIREWRAERRVTDERRTAMSGNGTHMVVDSDAHVVETEHTWDYLDASEKKYRPQLFGAPEDLTTQYWVLDGRVLGFRFQSLSEQQLDEVSAKAGRQMQTPKEARELRDVQLRLDHLDELGIDVQVLYNTMWIEQVTDHADAEIALCGSWNRWMADVWKQGGGRLRWVCVVPAMTMSEALEQIRFSQGERRRGRLPPPLRRRPAPGGPVLLPDLRRGPASRHDDGHPHRHRQPQDGDAVPAALRQRRRTPGVPHPHGLPVLHGDDERGAQGVSGPALGIHRVVGPVGAVGGERDHPAVRAPQNTPTTP